MSALTDVLDLLARAVDDDPPDETALGSVSLRANQLAAVRSIRAALAEFGGALLADEPGLGKTYTALAVARDFPACTVVAPASLRAMWRESSDRAGVAVSFISLESVSRGHAPPPAALMIVDEAHRAANPGAARYGLLALAAMRSRVLLLTATPVRNRRAEIDALLGLFLGGRAVRLNEDALGRCIIRRVTAGAVGVPEVREQRPIRAPGGPGIAEGIAALPDPLPLDGASAAGALVRAGLARYWASSESALERALARRLQRGLAMRDMLDAGQRPTRDDIRAWVLGDDATQLAFALGHPDASGAIAEWRRQLDAHLTAVSALRVLVARSARGDAIWRAEHLRRIADRHAGSVVVAFTTFEATAQAIFNAIRSMNGVALLTGRGARSAAGSLDREHVIARLRSDEARTPGRSMDIRLVIATDLLSEGVNLQGASVIVHLDQPWTPAGVAQRVGRAARMGSTHTAVHEYRFRAPRSTERLLSMDRVHAKKRAASDAALAASIAHQRLRQIVARWRAAEPSRGHAPYAAADAKVNGFIARIETPARAWIVGGRAGAGGRVRIADGPDAVLRLAESVVMEDSAPPSKTEVDRATLGVMHWLERQRAARATGIGLGPSQHRRRLLARLDALLQAAPPSRRPVLAARVGRLRAILLDARSVATDLHARALLEDPPDAGVWLDDVERRLNVDRVALDPVHEHAEVSALLILRRTVERHVTPPFEPSA